MSTGIKEVFNFSSLPHIISKGYDNLALRLLDENISVSQLFANSSLPSFALLHGCSMPAMHSHDLPPPPPPPPTHNFCMQLSSQNLSCNLSLESIPFWSPPFFDPSGQNFAFKILIIKCQPFCLLLAICNLSWSYHCWKYTFHIYEFKSLAFLGFYRES